MSYYTVQMKYKTGVGTPITYETDSEQLDAVIHILDLLNTLGNDEEIVITADIY